MSASYVAVLPWAGRWLSDADALRCAQCSRAAWAALREHALQQAVPLLRLPAHVPPTCSLHPRSFGRATHARVRQADLAWLAQPAGGVVLAAVAGSLHTLTIAAPFRAHIDVFAALMALPALRHVRMAMQPRKDARQVSTDRMPVVVAADALALAQLTWAPYLEALELPNFRPRTSDPQAEADGWEHHGTVLSLAALALPASLRSLTVRGAYVHLAELRLPSALTALNLFVSSGLEERAAEITLPSWPAALRSLHTYIPALIDFHAHPPPRSLTSLSLLADVRWPPGGLSTYTALTELELIGPLLLVWDDMQLPASIRHVRVCSWHLARLPPLPLHLAHVRLDLIRHSNDELQLAQ